ncbi:MAG TPA: heparan-alpha-glucosaminide N-acetyltransferase domain-containing protein [Roseimicrobium sp.]|nr:heparan-alpha-glucosaminide N-acetyltransferase domain-containing protein [Roseimicrobium sp.]
MSTASTAPAPSTTPVKSQRLMSLDALRGFDMFWIIGADAIVRALDRMGDNPLTKLLATQLTHKDWAGFAFYDLIFPLFLFIAGVSMVFSLTKEFAEHGQGGACQRVIRRGLLLVIIGIFYSGGFSNEWPNMRLLGVLQRIGLAYMFGGLLFIFLKPRALVAACAGILVGYWALMTFVPIRDIQLDKTTLEPMAKAAGTTNSPAFARTTFENTTARTTGKFDKGYNLSNHVDYQYLPGKKYDTYYDPEGILSTIPAIATCLLGAFAGLLLQSANFCNKWKLIYLISIGTACVIVGFLWGLQFPVVKKLWTSSFVLVAGGYAAILLAGFYWVVDVLNCRSWCQPFVWIGTNSITIYLANNIIGFRKLADRFVGGDIRNYLDTHLAKGLGEMVLAMTGIGIGVLLVWFLHRKKIFLRL